MTSTLAASKPTAISKQIPELLAPAGDWDALKAAVANGADAVYFGLSNFNARHRATNFKTEELPAVMAYLHAHNVCGYLTFNTLIFSDELPDAVAYIQQIAMAAEAPGGGIDAVIVQDLGLARLIHRMCPTLPIHGSTQMTLTESGGISLVNDLVGGGLERVILARELSLPEIRKITAESPIAVEVFIHGALCIAYSGQCLTSESFGGRSANRGQCAQACRLPYELIVDGVPRDLGDMAYLLSPQDLAAHDLVLDLSQAGVRGLKVEGRLKSAHYVAATTQTYRESLDAAAQGMRFTIAPEAKLNLEQSFSRGFTHGFLGGVNPQELVAGRFPKARGTLVGTFAGLTPRGCLVKLTNLSALLKPGDGVVFDEGHPDQDEQGGRVFAVHQLNGARGPGVVEIELGHGDVQWAALASGSEPILVWKTDDPAVRKRLEQSFARDVIVRRRPLTARVKAHVGSPLEVTLEAEGHQATAIAPTPLAVAQKHPVTEESLRDQLGRLGETPYELAQVTLDAQGGPMVPKSVLNELRRQVVEKLLALRGSGQRYGIADATALDELRTEAKTSPTGGAMSSSGGASGGAMPSGAGAPLGMPISPPSTEDTSPLLTVMVRTPEQLSAVLAAELPLKPTLIYCDYEDVRRYKEAVAACRAASRPVALSTLRIIKPTEHGLLKQIADAAPDVVLVRNLAAIAYYRKHYPQLRLLGDYALNVANELTASLFLRQGLEQLVPSYDLNFAQLAAMLGQLSPDKVAKMELVLHQHMPMFHVEHCVFAHTLSKGKDYHDCGRPCDTHRVDLKDRVGQAHPLLPDTGCRNTLFNAEAQTAAVFVPELRGMGIRRFRVELLREDGPASLRLLEQYGRVLLGQEDSKTILKSLRVLNQLGVTSGTLNRE